MELPELNILRERIEAALSVALPDHARRISIEHGDSPNPLCFFEVDGTCFAQGSFWANDEYCIEAMNTLSATEIMNEVGTASSQAEALAVVMRFCRLAK
jgi:hypothetical protein